MFWVFYERNKFDKPPQSSQEIDAQVVNAKIEKCLLDTLFAYQRSGVAFGLEKRGQLLIAGRYLLLTEIFIEIAFK